MRSIIAGLAVAAVAAGIHFAHAAAPDPTAPTASQFLRVSTMEGLRVRNEAGENLGKIKDVVVDLKTGTIRYLALDFGGFLGIGDKYFAVPWSMFKYQREGVDEQLILNVSRERLRDAPGFDKNHWPNMADPTWSTDIDAFFGSYRASTK